MFDAEENRKCLEGMFILGDEILHYRVPHLACKTTMMNRYFAFEEVKRGSDVK